MSAKFRLEKTAKLAYLAISSIMAFVTSSPVVAMIGVPGTSNLTWLDMASFCMTEYLLVPMMVGAMPILLMWIPISYCAGMYLFSRPDEPRLSPNNIASITSFSYCLYFILVLLLSLLQLTIPGKILAVFYFPIFAAVNIWLFVRILKEHKRKDLL